ncbi:hypothetical protein JoomaDRAFT_2055 [Galbibacter orientalis DSM 19592]|uniref:Sugar phosphate permease n=1 Tax=Galbibacter orientalis DSM 19592 TaxID=926559 RepID=I3C606_9FLAO|nr:DUF5690 family protein [Galbibacter orientalis]EIJ39049.1 hypothetical protein JoomaDRAFT_2055 [Galbibacter orientalis DSM 19592]
MKYTKTDIKTLLYGSFAAFGTYFCMYAFRKPFTVATYEGLSFWEVDYKIILIIAQVLGYMLSKFIGIKLISELRNNQRLLLLITMIAVAEISLVLFAVVPAPYNLVFMFLNGLPLGVIWGIVFSYLEGRKTTEILGVVLCSSFIVSSGAVKSVGLISMRWIGVNEFWMPAVTGAIFIVPFLIFSYLLERIPSPTPEDISLRTERKPMSKVDRANLIKTYFFPIVILVFFYAALTALRDYRDNFSREIWDALGLRDSIAIYTFSEIPIAILVLVILGLFAFIKSNFRVFIYYHYLLFGGAFVIGLLTVFYQLELISEIFWMISVGFGLYICYVPFNCIFFDRMIAAFRIKGNAGFLIYIADAFGYLGSIAVLLYKNFGQGGVSWLNFFIYGCYLIAALGCIVAVASLNYFKKKYKSSEKKISHLLNIAYE